ncbi:MAG: hypothetical protein RMJ83_09900 [Armatimonadota bacterium]|nr:hypothetical protein [Armatimonadota bacterium]
MGASRTRPYKAFYVGAGSQPALQKRDEFKLEALTSRQSKRRDVVGADADATAGCRCYGGTPTLCGTRL